jgi:transposase InsO family protein
MWTCDIKVLPTTYVKGKKLTGVFSIIDQYSKYLFSTPLTSESLDENIRCLELWLEKVKELGVDKQVRIVRSDNGSGFQDRFTEWLADHDIKHIKGPRYTPTAQGQIESSHKALASYLLSWARQRFGDEKRWPGYSKTGLIRSTGVGIESRGRHLRRRSQEKQITTSRSWQASKRKG